MLGKINSFHSTLAWKFANFHIPSLQIFFSKKHVVGFVNLKPAVPGHVLVSPRRHVQRLKDLDAEETKHLWLGVAEVQRVIEEKYKVDLYSYSYPN